MTSRRRQVGQKFQYPFVVVPLLGDWEVLFTDTERPYREALLASKEQALALAEARNECWRASRELTYALITRLTERARLDVSSRRLERADSEGLLQRSIARVTEIGKGIFSALQRSL